MILRLKRCYFSSLSSEKMIKKLIEKLDKENIEDYEISEKIPKDVISISSDISSLNVYLPRDFEYSQYDIDDFVRSMVPHMRTTTRLDRDIYIMKFSNPLNFDQYYNLIKFIIETEDFCTIIYND